LAWKSDLGLNLEAPVDPAADGRLSRLWRHADIFVSPTTVTLQPTLSLLPKPKSIKKQTAQRSGHLAMILAKNERADEPSREDQPGPKKKRKLTPMTFGLFFSASEWNSISAGP
jgi:hypothetical protein